MKESGYFQIYTGDGKGKTTAAIGLAVRAMGHGYRVYFGQFMKGQDYGELHSLKRFEDLLTHEQLGNPGWVFKDRIKPEQIALAKRGLHKVRQILEANAHDVVILDEINMALWFDLLQLDEVLELVRLRPKKTELVFTGRSAHPQLIELADLVTEMRCIKHYYNAGVPSREGIEN